MNRDNLYSLSEAVATLLRNGDTNFYRAFDEAFRDSNFHPDDKGVVMKEVGSILNWRRQKKRMAQSHRVVTPVQPLRKPVAEQTEFGISLRQPD